MFENLLSFLLASTLSLASMGNETSIESFDDSTLLTVDPIPYQQEEFVSPSFMSAAAIYAFDLDSQITLFERNSTTRLPIASLTKLMTAYIVLEENDTDEVVTVSGNAASTVGSSMGLYSGEQITIKNLLYGLLIESGNDAAIALAEHNAGSADTFVTKMNETAKKLGMDNTNYANTTGLDSSVAYSTAQDLALLSTYLTHNPEIKQIVGLSATDVTSTNGISHHLESTNILLGEMGIKGLITGKTPAAGECLITLAESTDGHEIITIVLGSDNRFSDTRTLIDWIYRAFIW